ncbi:MAG TPA: type II secretion system protein GspM [Stellaceae bacterium]|nr:type II secretion system protein GspM [Stellaceae bacterium]
MSLTDRATARRAAALAILAALIVAFWFGPVGAYRGLIDAADDRLAAKAAVLARYRALADGPTPATLPSAAGRSLLYPEMPDSQAAAMLQETVKGAATAARIQVQGLQMLRSEALPGATRIGVRIRASGDMPGLRSLIYAIESARPVLYADNLQVQSPAPSPGAAAPRLDFQLDIAGFKTEPAP